MKNESLLRPRKKGYNFRLLSSATPGGEGGEVGGGKKEEAAEEEKSEREVPHISGTNKGKGEKDVPIPQNAKRVPEFPDEEKKREKLFI